MTRVLFVTTDHVGSRMAGPAIRYVELARALAREHDVALAAPNEPDVPLPVRVTRTLRGERPDVVIAQKLAGGDARELLRRGARLVLDLYAPSVPELLAFAELEAAPRPRGAAHTLLVAAERSGERFALNGASAYLCATERQRDYYLGLLSALGRLDGEAHRRDPSFRTLVEIVPFGLPLEPPAQRGPALKGVVPGIAPHDKVALWAGGLWDWLDPLTPIRGVAELARRRPDVKLVFLGLDHPSPSIARMAMADRAVELARELGVLDRTVFFLPGWVPYEDRQNYLLQADLGVSAHRDTIEARFAFRTRFLDHFWAGLPTIATRGDSLAELAGEHGAALLVQPGDAAGWARALEEALKCAPQLATGAERLREQFTWPNMAQRLARVVREVVQTGPPAVPRRLELQELAARAGASTALRLRRLRS